MSDSELTEPINNIAQTFISKVNYKLLYTNSKTTLKNFKDIKEELPNIS